jgi:hypothetical protein
MTEGGDLDATQVADVLRLADLAAVTDGVPPLSEHVLLHLRYDRAAPEGSGAGRDFVVTVDGKIAGYAYLDPPEPEVSGGGGESARGWSATWPPRRTGTRSSSGPTETCRPP